MIAHYGIDQQTEEWFRLKWAMIGGTRSKGLFVKSDTLLIELLAEITEPFDMDYEGYASDDMIRGNEMEPYARAALSEYLGIELHQCGWLQSTENPLLGISVDGISAAQDVTAEIKCPAAKRHIATCLADEIPLDNIHQSIHYFTVNPKMQRHYFASYRPEFKLKPLFVKELTRTSEVNIGTKARPVMVTVNDAVKMAKAAELELQEQIKQSLETLKF